MEYLTEVVPAFTLQSPLMLAEAREVNKGDERCLSDNEPLESSLVNVL